MGKRKKKAVHRSQTPAWLPFDTRLLPDIFSFGHVTGVARIFLIVEISLSILIVIGTLLLVVFRLLV